MIVTAPPLILLPGLGADARMFREQQKAFPQLVVPPWIPPLPNETLGQYSRRMMEAINPRGPFYLGGASFGGMIACEMAQVRPPLGLFLLSSGRSPRYMKRWVRQASSIAPLAKILPWNTAALLAELGLALPGKMVPFRLRVLLKHLHLDQVEFMRWGLPAVLQWKASEWTGDFPIHQLHGERDPFLLPLLPHAQVVPGGGHLLTKTHPEVVNAFLKERMV